MLTENDYAQWLFNTPGLGSKGVYTLLDKGYSCEDIFKCPDKELRTLLTAKKADALIKHRQNWNFELERIKLEEKKVRFVSALDPDFPKKLKNIPDPPFGLYVRGKLPDENKPSVAIIGARMCSDYGRYMAREFGRNLSLAGVQIISGMARGIDGISQKAAIDAGGSSYGILGCGVNICYPDENRDVFEVICNEGGLISEYYPDMLPMSGLFPQRNRIISGLSDIVLVVEARQKSGTQITVDQALEQGKEVLAIPGRTTDRLSDGCNFLISQGAGIALNTQDVLDRLWGHHETSTSDQHEEEEILDPLEKEPEKTLEEEITDIIDIIPVSTSQILEKLHQKEIDISIPMLMSNLMELTFKGEIIQDGVYYRKRYLSDES
ncbi:MAG: DNA-processing protein DprA [Butyrivibrio sp.]|nr:DNA-processing protein DprA [Butyrivibrio sp.]